MTKRGIAKTIAAAAFFLLTLSSCTSKLLDSIKDDVDEQKLADIIAEQDGNTPGTKKPTVEVFQWSGAVTSTNNPAVSFNLSAKANAVSELGPATVDAWYVSESSDVPAADDPKWAAAQPTSYVFSCVNGTRTLYARARDSLGNVSAAAVLTIGLSPLGVDWNESLAFGQEIVAHESLSFTAREPLSATGLTVSGTLGAGIATATGTGNATVTVKPGATGTGLWQAGAGTVTVHCVTAYGLPLDATIDVKPFNGVCVSTTGSDGNEGGVHSPCKTIAAGIVKATAKYGTGASVVRVAKGTYSIDSSDASQQIKLAAGVTVTGEYSADFLTFSPAASTQFRSTVIKDIRSTDGTSGENAMTATVLFNALSASAGIAYIKIEGASVTYCPVVQCIDSPAVIEHCDIINGGGGNDRYGIRVYGTSSPTIQFNNINYDPSTSLVIGGSSSMTRGIGIRLYVYAGTVGVVGNNTISGGNVSTTDPSAITVAITAGSGNGSLIIRANKIIAGTGYSTYSLQTLTNTNMTLNIYNNLLRCGNGALSYGLKLVSNTTYSPKYLVRNNTIVLGKPAVSSVAEFCVYVDGLDSGDTTQIENNLIYLITGPSCITAVYDASSSGTSILSAFKNNGFIGINGAGLGQVALYGVEDNGAFSDGFANYDTVSSLETFLGSVVASGNLIVTESSINGTTDFSFKTSNGMGLDGASLAWGFNNDYQGTLRTGNGSTGWSVGYLEED